MQTLQIYKASAGSGKTFTLAVEYIKLLVQNPESYRNILAVTFTNKATAEMKERILSQLYGIAHKLPDSQNYYDKIQEDLRFSEEIIRKNCETALHNILHNFSYFHVETIDSFFQMIIRNLAHELNLSNSITLDLDQQGAIDEAVDSLMENLTAGSHTIQLILSYIREQVDSDKNWNITRNLKKFGKNMFLEAYQNHASELKKGFEDGSFQKYKEELQKTLKMQQDCMKEYGEAFMASLDEYNLRLDEFKGKASGGVAYFTKLQTGNIDDKIMNVSAQKFMESADAWPGPGSKNKALILELAETLWIQMMTDAEKARQKVNKIVKTCHCILKNFNDLQLLSSIYTQLNLENLKGNRILLAQTPMLLNSLIDKSDTPFIFEKIGTRLNHIMIDEFQDTSRLQWNNFKSLIVECMSKNKSNLIVGDLKQSIYRWREGDWSILKNIHRELPPIGELKEIRLDTNRRSAGNIIRFNNDFFKQVSEVLDQQEQAEKMTPQILQVYSDVEQKTTIKNEGKGFVKVILINDKDTSRPEDYATETLKETGNTIQELLAQGAKMQDIAILVRTNKHIPEIASYFSENLPEIPIVSAEAFLLGSSQAVNTIIDALRYLNDETDTLSAVLLAHQYQTQILKQDMSWNDLCLAQEKYKLLPDEFLTKKDTLRLLPLYELIENLIQIFHLKELEQQDAYVFYFLDEVTEFLKNEPGDIVTFLKYWEDTLKAKKIPAGKIQGVQVISIHKSKGLEFNHVIIPFCDWKMSQSGDILWIESKVTEEQKLPVVPANFNEDLKGSIFKEAYQNEQQQQWIDNVNLLYVAFTRPKANLFVIGRCPKTESLNTVSDLLYKFLDAPKEENADFTYTTGGLYFPSDKAETSENPLLKPSAETPVHLESSQPKIEFRQSNKSQQFLDLEDGKQNTQEEFIEEGVILHNLFSTIRTLDDMEPQLQQLEFEGNVETKLTQKRIEQLVHKALQNPTAQDWFSSKWEVINECTILQHTPDGLKTLRPDRVMIRDGKVMVVDFKFGNPKEEHHEQVRSYMNLLLQMGYAQVEGCLWYVYKNKIEPVTLK